MDETTLGPVEYALILASNAMYEIDPSVSSTPRGAEIDLAIDHALRLVQAWQEEDESGLH